MSTADDILFEPISTSSSTPTTRSGTWTVVEQALLDGVAAALKGTGNVEFSINPLFQIAAYDQVIDMVESDPDQIVFLDHMVYRGNRPSTALTMRDVFRRMMAGDMDFYHCGKASTGGSRVGLFHFKNVFGISERHPYLLLDNLKSNCFEWWAASLVSTHSGHHEHYTFATRDEAHKYYYSNP